MPRSPRPAPAVHLDVLNHTRGRLPGRKLLRKAAQMALARAAGCGPLATTLVCVGQREMTKLNARFYRCRRPTDVLSFPHGEPDRETGRWLAGEVVICRDVAVREARARGLSVAGELLLYAVHGWLHLAGYDDHDPRRARRMHERAREILAGRSARAVPARLWAGLLEA